MLRQRIVLPHLDPMLIEQKLGVCIVVLKQGVQYQDKKIHVVTVLTTPDKTSHLTILYHINRMAKDAEFIEQLIALEDEGKIKEAIQGFSSEQED